MNEYERKRVVVFIVACVVFIGIVVLWAVYALPIEFQRKEQSELQKIMEREGKSIIGPLQQIQQEAQRILTQTSTRELIDAIARSASSTESLTASSTILTTSTTTRNNSK